MSAKSDSKVLPMRGVPIIGETTKATFHQLLVTVIASCGCGDPTPVILPNVAAVHTCPGCGDQHYLKTLTARSTQPGEGGIDLELGRLSTKVPSSFQ